MNNSNIEKALHLIPSPTALVGAKDGNIHDIATVSWFIQESVNPPQILVNIAPGRLIYELIDKKREFMLTILADGSEHVADVCGHTSGKEIDKIETLGLRTSKSNRIDVPGIDGAVANIECIVKDIFRSGDHSIVVGEVVDAVVNSQVNPLICFNGEYSSLQAQM